ncbi:MAG TPA: biopolymer transporter ExbD [Pirellulales bacterium]|nr:biopolymer transporter ExbD [Pirellulales bacterium]
MATRKKFDTTAEGDMTPMIDMTFQLIAFFMVLLNFGEGEQDARIKLPKSELAKPPDSPMESPLVLQLTNRGTVLLIGDELSIEQMSGPLLRERQLLERQGKHVADASVIIRADAGAQSGLVQELIQKCQENGFEKFALRAKQEARGP